MIFMRFNSTALLTSVSIDYILNLDNQLNTYFKFQKISIESKPYISIKLIFWNLDNLLNYVRLCSSYRKPPTKLKTMISWNQKYLGFLKWYFQAFSNFFNKVHFEIFRIDEWQAR